MITASFFRIATSVRNIFRLQIVLAAVAVLTPVAAWAGPGDPVTPHLVSAGGWHGWQNLGQTIDGTIGLECFADGANVTRCLGSAVSADSNVPSGKSEVATLVTITDGSGGPTVASTPLAGMTPAAYNYGANRSVDNQRMSCTRLNQTRFDCFALGGVAAAGSPLTTNVTLFHLRGPVLSSWENVDPGEKLSSYPSCFAAPASRAKPKSSIGCLELNEAVQLKETDDHGNGFSTSQPIATGAGVAAAQATEPHCMNWRKGSAQVATCLVDVKQSVPTGVHFALDGFFVDGKGRHETLLPMSAADGTSIGSSSPINPSCAFSAGTLFCVGIADGGGDNQFLVRWSTTDGVKWSGPQIIDDDFSDRPLFAKFSGRHGVMKIECVATGSDRVDCLELIYRGGFTSGTVVACGPGSQDVCGNQTSGTVYPALTVHLRDHFWNAGAKGSGVNLEEVKSPVPVGLGLSGNAEMRCLSRDHASIDCYMVATGAGPILRASFTPAPVQIHAGGAHLPGH